MHKLTSWILAIIVSFTSFASAGEKVVLRADSWFPYNGDPKAEKPGYIIEIAKAIFGKAGLEVDYQTEGWTFSRSLQEGNKGTIDGVIGCAKSDAPNFIFADEPLGFSGNGLFVKKGTAWKYTGVDSLKNKSLAVIGGYTYGEPLDAYIKENKQNEARIQATSDDSPLELNIKKLMAGRVDVVLEDHAVFQAKLREMKLEDQFELAGSVGEPQALYIAFAPNKDSSRKLAQQLGEGIRQLRQSGELGKILAKYGLSDWKK